MRRRIARLLFQGLLAGSLLATAVAQAAECVVLLHGLARSADSMSVMEAHLQAAGYVTVNVDYPSRHHPVDVLSVLAVEQGVRACQEQRAAPIHFVTHSMGGILLRHYSGVHSVPDMGRAVMLGPPNQGSEVVDKLGNWPGFAWLNGPAGQQLGTTDDSVPLALGPVTFDVGVIAGTQSINWILSVLIPGADDGKVSVARAHVENETDFRALSVTHPLMMRNREVIAATLHFLRHGAFPMQDSDHSATP